MRRVCLDPGRARIWLDWQPRVDVRQGLEMTWVWFAAQPGEILGRIDD